MSECGVEGDLVTPELVFRIRLELHVTERWAHSGRVDHGTGGPVNIPN